MQRTARPPRFACGLPPLMRTSLGDHTMRATVLLLSVLLPACSPSGEWIDDPRNFTRAWGVPCPEGVSVVHSSYWRSGHFTREEVLFFQIGRSHVFRENFIHSNGFVPVDLVSVSSHGYCRDAPSWFLPGPSSRYRAWSVPSPPTAEGSSPFIAEDLETGTLYVYACRI